MFDIKKIEEPKSIDEALEKLDESLRNKNEL